jgi:hypothetical protein
LNRLVRSSRWPWLRKKKKRAESKERIALGSMCSFDSTHGPGLMETWKWILPRGCACKFAGREGGFGESSFG